MSGPDVYLVSGDDPFLTGEAVSGILAGADRLSVDEFGAGDDPAGIFLALETPSMLGGRRCVLVRGLDDFPAEVHRRLAAYLESPNPECLLIMTTARDIASVSSAVKKAGRVIPAGRGRRQELQAWIREQARGAGLKLSTDGAEALIEAAGEERLALAQAIEELALALGEGKMVRAAEVHAQFERRGERRVYGFVDAVAARRTAVALTSMRDLVRRGESAGSLWWAVARTLKMLMQVGGRNVRQVQKEMGIEGWRAEKLVRQARNFRQEELVDLYRELAAADRRIKRGEESEELALERLIVALGGAQRAPVPGR